METQTKIEKFNRENLRLINAEISNALQSVAVKYGIKINLGNTTFSDIEYSTKVVVKLPDTDNKKALESFQYAELLGLPKDIQDKQFNMNGKRFHVVELAMNRSKRPCVIQEVGKPSEKRFLATVEQINLSLGIKTHVLHEIKSA